MRIAQLIPRTYWSTPEREDGTPTLVIWKMWLGRVYDVTHYPPTKEAS